MFNWFSSVKKPSDLGLDIHDISGDMRRDQTRHKSPQMAMSVKAEILVTIFVRVYHVIEELKAHLYFSHRLHTVTFYWIIIFAQNFQSRSSNIYSQHMSGFTSTD